MLLNWKKGSYYKISRPLNWMPLIRQRKTKMKATLYIFTKGLESNFLSPTLSLPQYKHTKLRIFSDSKEKSFKLHGNRYMGSYPLCLLQVTSVLNCYFRKELVSFFFKVYLKCSAVMQSSLDFYHSSLKISSHFQGNFSFAWETQCSGTQANLRIAAEHSMQKTDEISKVFSYYYLFSLDKWHNPV